VSEALAALVVLLGITVLALVYVFRPLGEGPADGDVSARPSLQAQYERVLAMLRDLEADWRTGKIPEEDYRELRRRYLEEGAALLRALQEGSEEREAMARVEAAVRARRASRQGRSG